MFIIKWWRFFRGYLVVSLRGRGVERLLNMAMSRGIGFWDLQRTDIETRLSLPLASFYRLRPLVRQTRCRLHILKKAGLPFLTLRARRRMGLLLGAVLFCTVLYILSMFVWFINIKGNESVSREEILRLATEVGIKRGVWKRKLDLPELEEELARRHAQIAWVGMRIQGTMLEIEIVEHRAVPEEYMQPADLVAAKDGLVERVLVVEGVAVVAPGDTVAKGDLLIKGVRVMPEGILPNGTELPPEGEPVRARGEVEARVWYEARVPVKEKVTTYIETGESRSGWALKWPGHSLRIWGTVDDPFRFSRREAYKRVFQWRNLSLPVEVHTVIYYELQPQEVTVAPQRALLLAREQAWEEVRGMLPPQVRLENSFIEEYTADGQKWLHLVVETRENIAEIRLQQP